MVSFRLGLGRYVAGIAFGLAAALGATLLSLPLPAQEATQPLPEAGQSTTTLTMATREVLLDVVVNDKSGQPVTGLTASDFTVTEDGATQHLTHLEEHHPMSAADMAKLKARPVLPPNTFTNFTPVENTNASTVILLDALDTGVEAQMQLRGQLIDYMKHMQPGTPIAIFQMDTEMRLIQGFSSDPEVLLQAAKSKRDMPSLLRPVRGSREEYRRVRLGILHSGFQMMGRYLAGFPGRKNLIWFTGSIPQSYLSDPAGSSFGRSFKDDFSVFDNQGGLTDALTLSRVAVYPIDARGLLSSPQFDVSNRGRPSAGSNMRFEGTQAFQHMDLDAIADATGGKAYYNTNGLKELMAEIVSNGSNYYTLAYATTNQKWDGQYRHIKVVLDRPGLRLQHRPGYYAVDRAKAEQRLLAAMQRKKDKAGSNPFEEGDAESGDSTAQAGSAPVGEGALVKHPKGGFEATMQLGAAPPTEIILTASLSIDDAVVKLDRKSPLPEANYLEADYKGKPFRVYSLQIRADAGALRLNQTADGEHHGTVQFVTLVFDQNGNRVNSLLSTAVLNLSDTRYRQMLAHGLPVRQQIAVPVKGNYFLRVGVHDVASDHIGALEIPVDAVHAGLTGQDLAKP